MILEENIYSPTISVYMIQNKKAKTPNRQKRNQHEHNIKNHMKI